MRIAQRGVGPIAGTTGYLIDRFTCYSSYSSGTITQTQSQLVASDIPYQTGFRYYANLYCNSSTSGGFSFFNYIQSTELITISDWNWGTSFGAPVTLSFWFRSNAPTGSLFTMCLNVYGTGVNYLAPYTVNSSGAWQYVTMTIPPPPNGTSLGYQGGGVGPYITSVNASTTGTLGWSSGSQCISGTYNWTTQAGNYVHFTGVQLEKGTVATPFEVRPYATELALCQRYYVQFTVQSGGNYPPLGTGFATSSTAIEAQINLPVPLRASPTNLYSSAGSAAWGSSITQSSTPTASVVYMFINATNVGFTGFFGTNGIHYPTGKTLDLVLTGGSGLTAGQGGIMYMPNNTAGNYLGISAEL
jgi:hypothetical protein